CQQYNRDPLTF
nr:immunoglobulin light chain junction region [Macaca mulatta]MOV75596.1 immunoglobulin light chain junction region [Macaca mulatta]MOV75968.1 immunoglobulin light chain junction region [Macaca mulatta]MOV77036.1 immunoglobulin light chain junction region [Macaca mulatta]